MSSFKIRFLLVEHEEEDTNKDDGESSAVSPMEYRVWKRHRRVHQKELQKNNLFSVELWMKRFNFMRPKLFVMWDAIYSIFVDNINFIFRIKILRFYIFILLLLIYIVIYFTVKCNMTLL